MRVVHVASEVAPWAMTGGLADVVAALPAALTAADPAVTTATVVPLYRMARARLAAAGVALSAPRPYAVTVGERVWNLNLRRAAGVWFVECDPLYDRDGLYGEGGRDHFDNAERFAVLARAALVAGASLVGGAVEVWHGHDWQAGLALIWAALERQPGARVMTIHNLAYRGLYPKETLTQLGLPWTIFTAGRAEFYDQLSLLKGGLAFADVATTVSPTYAREILTPARGEGLDGFLRHDVATLVGVVNGIDVEAWDPRRDPSLPARFDARDPLGKAACRAAVADELGLELGDATPLCVAIARLTPQKGLDLVAAVAADAVAAGARLAVLGSGDAELEDRLQRLADEHPGAIAVRLGFDPDLARRMYGGADLFLMPSRFEPCGLGQLYAMRYGAVPVVAAVGGLADTVIDADRDGGTGFCFEHVDAAGLAWALGRAIAMFREEPARFAAVRAAAMARDSSWTTSARAYLALYRAAQQARR